MTTRAEVTGYQLAFTWRISPPTQSERAPLPSAWPSPRLKPPGRCSRSPPLVARAEPSVLRFLSLRQGRRRLLLAPGLLVIAWGLVSMALRWPARPRPSRGLLSSWHTASA